jgi:hypothetical protein
MGPHTAAPPPDPQRDGFSPSPINPFPGSVSGVLSHRAWSFPRPERSRQPVW